MNHCHQTSWENYATVKTKSRLLFDPQQTGYLYPVCKQPLSVHPNVTELGEEAVSFLLTQSFYKYTHDIALIETRVVNQSILDVTTGIIDLPFSEEQKSDLFTVMVDEAYHAYVAYVAMQQIQQHTQISPIELPSKIEIELAIDNALQRLPETMHSLFKLIAVCIAENTLTHEIKLLLGDKTTHPFFQQMLSNHLLDEGRHSKIFINLLAFIWKSLEKPEKMLILEVLPEFISQYLGASIQQKFERNILKALNIQPYNIQQIMADTFGDFKLSVYHPMYQNILSALLKAGVVDHETIQTCFAD